MAKRGRKSTEELAAQAEIKPRRPKAPPVDFTEYQSQIWHTLVKVHGVFRDDQWDMVEAYCRACSSVRRIGELINDIESEVELDISRYNSALRMRERESRLAASLAIRLGIAKTTDRNKKALEPAADGS